MAEEVKNVKDLLGNSPKEDVATEATESEVIETSSDEELPPEAVVKADEGEMEREQNRSESVRTTRRQRVTAAINPRDISTMGVKSDEIQRNESLQMTEKEKENAVFRALDRSRRNGEVLWGTVYGVERADESTGFKNRIFVDVMFSGVTIYIPDNAYFESTFEFAQGFENMSDADKAANRMRMARFQIGANICFVVKSVTRDRIREGEFAGEYQITAVGSRVEAMEILRKNLIIGKNINIGDITTAHVLSVREDLVIVEALGVETRIDAYNLGNGNVENCRDYVRPGDDLKVRIKKLHVEGDRVYLTVSGRLNDTSKNILLMKEQSTIMGIVDHYNKDKEVYTIILENGVSASVRAGQVNGEIDLAPGDRVSVLVTRIMPTYVIGYAVKC